MNLDGILAMRDSATLKEAIQRASARKPTTEEMLAQRVSFVFASVSDNSTVTKDQVRKAIVDLAGGATTAAAA